MRRGNEPPFSFRRRRKENGRSRSKEKALGRLNLTQRCQVDRKRESCCGRCLRKLAVSCRVRRTQAEPGAPAAASRGFRLAFGADDEWTSSSFRAPRFAQRWPPGAPGQRQRKETQTKSVKHHCIAIPDRGPQTETFSKAGPAPNADGFRIYPSSLFGTPRFSVSMTQLCHADRKALSLWTGRGPFLFPREREMGGVTPSVPREGDNPQRRSLWKTTSSASPK